MKPYRALVEAQRERNPCLHNLCKFLSDPTPNTNHRSCRIASIDFFAGTSSPTRRIIDSGSLLSELLCGYAANEDDGYTIDSDIEDISTKKNHILGRMIIIEDLTKETIEVLGSSLGIDPLFFASHIHTPWLEMESQTPDLATLPSRMRPSKYTNIHYHRTIMFDKVPPGRKLLRDANIDRKVVVVPLAKNKYIGLAQHCTSVLRVMRDTCWIGLVLVDPPITDRYLVESGKNKEMSEICLPSRFFLGGYEDFLDPLSLDQDIDKQSGPNRQGLMEDLIYYWSTEQPECFNYKEPTILAISYFPLRIVAAEWVKYVAVMYRSVKQYEYSNNELPSFLHQLKKLNSDMRSLQSWRRRSMSSQQKVRTVIRFLRPYKSLEMRDETYISLVEDYEHVSASIDECSRRLESMLPVVTSLVQIVDSRRSFAETANISRLTILALIFVPLTFVSSLFSMGATNGPGGPYFWVYFVVALPVTLIVFLIARPPIKEMRLLIDQIRKRRRWRHPTESAKASTPPSKKPEV